MKDYNWDCKRPLGLQKTTWTAKDHLDCKRPLGLQKTILVNQLRLVLTSYWLTK